MARPKPHRQPVKALSTSAGQNTHPNPGAHAPDSTVAFVTHDPAAAYAHFLAAAKAVPAGQERRLTAQPELVRHNLDAAVQYFVTIEADVIRAMPGCPAARFKELPSLALALMFATDQVVEKASDREIESRLAACGRLRAPMLYQLEVFAHPEVGIADSEVVKGIRAGKGPLDKARDAVNIVAYFQKLGPAIAGKHPFTDEQMATLASHGHWLIQQLTPGDAVPPASAPDPRALVRDQLWSLIWTRYDQLRGAVAAVRGVAGLDEVLPPLGTRTAPTRKTQPSNPSAQGPAATLPASPAAPADR